MGYLADYLDALVSGTEYTEVSTALRRMTALEGLGTIRLPPSGFDYTPPFSVILTSSGSYIHTFSMDLVKPFHTHTIYCGSGGNNANNGTSWATRVRSQKQAMVRANAIGSAASVVMIVMEAKDYWHSDIDGSAIPDDFSGQKVQRAGVVIVPCDSSGNIISDGRKIVSIHNQTMPSFVATSDANIYVSTFTTELPSKAAWDRLHLNAKGNPQSLRNVSGSLDGNVAGIISAINAMQTSYGQGAFYLDVANSKFYVRLSDNRAPEANFVVGRGSALSNDVNAKNLYLSGSAGLLTFWMRDVHTHGGNGFYCESNTPDGGVMCYAADCAFLYSCNNGVKFDGQYTSTLLRCTFDDAFKDGANYTQSTSFDPDGVAVSRAIELDCRADWNGNDNNSGESSANASSAHNRVRVLRINTVAMFTQNRAFYEIEQSRSWNLGCIAGSCRQTGTSSTGFVSGFYNNTGEQSIVWLDGCQSINNDYDLGAEKSGALYYENMEVSGYTLYRGSDNSGTIALRPY